MPRVIVVFLAMVFSLRAGWLSFDGTPTPTPPTINIIQNNEQFVTLNIHVHGVISTDTTVNRVTYQQLTIPSATWTSDTGKAEMPAMRRLIQIQPTSGTVISTTTMAETLLSNYNIFPTQIPASDSGPFPPFVKDTIFYNSDTWYPTNLATKSNPAILKDLRVVTLTIHPIFFNPAQHKLLAKKEFNISIAFEGYDPENSIPGPPIITDLSTDKTYQYAVLNYIPQVDTSIPEGGREGTWHENYVILTADAFYNTLAPLIFWKTKKGCTVTAKKLTEIPGYSGSPADTNIIRQYLHDLIIGLPYSQGVVLFVGNEDAIPPFKRWPHPSGDYIHSDHYYACLFGSDEIEDIRLGRLCVTTSAQVSNLINKIFAYERTPISSWNKNKVLLVAGWQYYQQGPCWYRDNKIAIRDGWLNGVNGAPYVELYLNDAQNGLISPQINNNGVGLVNFRGHGDPTLWWRNPGDVPAWQNTDVYALSNVDKYSMILNMTCNNARIQDPPECLAEAWTNATSKGAVGAFGATRPCYSQAAYTLDREIFCYFYSGLPEDAQWHTIGHAILMGRNKLIMENSTGFIATARMYLWLGDATLCCWQKDWGNLQITHPLTIQWKQPQTITVNVKRWYGVNWGPVREACVCLYKPDDGIHKKILTDNCGNAGTTITANHTGDLYVTVSYSNCRPYEGICKVTDKEASPLSFGETKISSATQLYSVIPILNDVVITYGLADGDIARMTIYDITGRKIMTLLDGDYAPGTHKLIWNRKDDYGRTVPAGIYFCELHVVTSHKTFVKKFFIP